MSCDLLYKYLPWRDDFFERPMLRFTPMANLNDVFEFQPAVTGEVSDKHFSKTKKKWEKILGKQTALDKSKFSQILHKKSPEVFGKVSTNIGVLSLSTKHDNLLMWSHYCKSTVLNSGKCKTTEHNGLVVGLNREKFLKHIHTEVSTDYIEHAQINYSQNRPFFALKTLVEPDFKNNFNAIIFNKSIDWEYESEYRIAFFKLDEYPHWQKNIPGLFTISSDIIEIIFLGLRVSEENAEIARNFCRNHKIKLVQATLDCLYYKLNFV